MQSETGFPSSHQLKSYVASKSRLKLAARAVLSADAGLLVDRFTNKSMLSNCFCCCNVKHSMIHQQKPRWVVVVYYSVLNDSALKAMTVIWNWK